MPDGRRRLPSVDSLLRSEPGRRASSRFGRPVVRRAIRAVLDEARKAAARGGAPPERDSILARAAALAARMSFGLSPVINATGVVLHTNLGRASLPEPAVRAVTRAARGYTDLEVDREPGTRGRRTSRAEFLLTALTGAEDALVVNNNAAAVLLALETLARGREVVVSRGELIEIGGEFRVPDIMARSGATLREVGTTNRTHLRDYAEAIGPDTALLLKVHTSNYRVVGFTAEVGSRELADLGRERGVPVMEDLGSGSLVDLRPWGFPHEPTVPEVVAAGIDLVTFSGDKLLGGPQAGILVGRRPLLARLKRNPLNRALRIDKLTTAALEATLYAYESGSARETVPTLQRLTEPLQTVLARARRLRARLGGDVRGRLGASIVRDSAQVGGGALPTVELPTAGLAVGRSVAEALRLDAALRAGDPPVVGRMLDDRLFLDCRTVLPGQVVLLARALAAVAPP